MSELPKSVLPVRVVHLSNYLRELVQDVQAQGKIAKIDGNPVQVAAVAILSGSIAVCSAMFEDVKVLAGNAKEQAKPIAQLALQGMAAHGAGMLINKIFGGKR